MATLDVAQYPLSVGRIPATLSQPAAFLNEAANVAQAALPLLAGDQTSPWIPLKPNIFMLSPGRVTKPYYLRDNSGLPQVGTQGAKNSRPFLADAVRKTSPTAKTDPFTLLSNQSCFVAGMPLLTPEGSKPIEHFREGDYVCSRQEDNPDGILLAKLVEEVFVRR